jgi:hypothetical protein
VGLDVQGSGFRVQGLGFRVWGLMFRFLRIAGTGIESLT